MVREGQVQCSHNAFRNLTFLMCADPSSKARVPRGGAVPAPLPTTCRLGAEQQEGTPSHPCSPIPARKRPWRSTTVFLTLLLPGSCPHKSSLSEVRRQHIGGTCRSACPGKAWADVACCRLVAACSALCVCTPTSRHVYRLPHRSASLRGSGCRPGFHAQQPSAFPAVNCDGSRGMRVADAVSTTKRLLRKVRFQAVQLPHTDPGFPRRSPVFPLPSSRSNDPTQASPFQGPHQPRPLDEGGNDLLRKANPSSLPSLPS